MTRFRLGISDLSVHRYRYKQHTEQDLLCPLCHDALETEVHFVLCCPALDSLREQLIPVKYYRYPSAFRLILLMSSTQENITKQFTIYLYKAFYIRSAACT